MECLLTVTMAAEPQSFTSVHQVLPRWGWFLQAATRNTSSESQGQLLLHRNQNHSPPPFPELETSKCECGWMPLCSLLRPAGSTCPAPAGAPSSKGSARYHVGPSSLVGQSPFSSNFCKLFCIFSSFMMFAVSSRQRASAFNCTCDPRLDGAACSA